MAKIGRKYIYITMSNRFLVSGSFFLFMCCRMLLKSMEGFLSFEVGGCILDAFN